MAPYILYCRSGYRRPILTRSPLFPRDPQAAIPFGWCSCGSEIFEAGQQLCSRCRNEKGELTE